MKTKLFLILVTILIASCASMKPYNPTIEVYGNDKNSYALTNQYSASWAQIEETMLNICKSKNMDGWATHEGTKPIGVIRVYFTCTDSTLKSKIKAKEESEKAQKIAIKNNKLLSYVFNKKWSNLESSPCKRTKDGKDIEFYIIYSDDFPYGSQQVSSGYVFPVNQKIQRLTSEFSPESETKFKYTFASYSDGNYAVSSITGLGVIETSGNEQIELISPTKIRYTTNYRRLNPTILLRDKKIVYEDHTESGIRTLCEK